LTVTWSTTIAVEVPDNFSFETVGAAYEAGGNQDSIVKILKDAYDNIGWRDGEITDIQDAPIFSEK
jgi:hypothetical protein